MNVIFLRFAEHVLPKIVIENQEGCILLIKRKYILFLLYRRSLIKFKSAFRMIFDNTEDFRITIT